MDITKHKINESALCINNKKYFGLNVDKILVGVEDETKTEILKDNKTNLNYARNAVEAQEVYNVHKQKHSNWFILDFENGSRGWFPGAIIKGNILEPTEIRSMPSDDAEILKVVDHVIVEVLDIDSVDEEPFYKGWYKIKYDLEGYVKSDALTDLRYEKNIN